MYLKIFFCVSIVTDIVAKKIHQVEVSLIFSFLSAIMYFQNVGMVTIAPTELIPHKF